MSRDTYSFDVALAFLFDALVGIAIASLSAGRIAYGVAESRCRKRGHRAGLRGVRLADRGVALEGAEPMKADMHVLALIKGQEKYVFLYDAQSRSACLQTLGRFASDPRLSFTWFDAATLAHKIRRHEEVCDGR